MTAPRRIDVVELRRLAEAGMSSVPIAQALGFFRTSVVSAAKRAGIILPVAPPSEFWATNIEHALTLRADGLSAAAIGAVIGCTKNAVIGRFNRMGLSAERGWHQRLTVLGPERRPIVRTACRGMVSQEDWAEVWKEQRNDRAAADPARKTRQ
jgi:hypothetical protein